MWIFFILFWLIASYRYMKKNTERIYSPIVWLLIGWFFSFGLYLFSGISYHYGLSIEAGAYYWGVCIAVVIGFKFSQRWRVVFGQRKNMHFIPRIDSITRNLYHLYCGVVILGSFLVVFDIMRLNVISFNLHSNLNISGIGNIGILMSSLGLILWLYECVYAIKNNVKFRPVAIICTIAYLIPALITSGRQSILIMAVSSFVTLFYCFSKWPHYKYKVYIYGPVVLAVWDCLFIPHLFQQVEQLYQIRLIYSITCINQVCLKKQLLSSINWDHLEPLLWKYCSTILMNYQCLKYYSQNTTGHFFGECHSYL